MSLFYKQNAAAVPVRICYGHALGRQSAQSGLAACWRHMEECVRATPTWQTLFVHLKKRGVDRIIFRPPEKFYLDGREVLDRCFHLSGWAFQFAEDSCGE